MSCPTCKDYIGKCPACGSKLPKITSAIPEDIIEAAERVLIEMMIPSTPTNYDAIARAILAERERHGWQPIETAPLDDMLILCGHKWDGDRSPIKIGYWRETHWHIFGASWKPTHWMPLPSPPKP